MMRLWLWQRHVCDTPTPPTVAHQPCTPTHTVIDQNPRPMIHDFESMPGGLSRMGSLPGTIHCQPSFGTSAIGHSQTGHSTA